MNPEDETFGATTANKAYEWAALAAEPAGATVEPTTYATVEALKAAVAANASNSGKIYKVGSTETGWTYYQCRRQDLQGRYKRALHILQGYKAHFW